MKDWYGRHPYISEAREAVKNNGNANLYEVVSDDTHQYHEAKERAVSRVKEAIQDQEINTYHENPEIELISYPLSRILVSLLNDDSAIERYIRAESTVDFDGLQNNSEVTLDLLLKDFDLSNTIEKQDSKNGEDVYEMGVAPFLDLSNTDWGSEWTLFGRGMSDGVVEITKADLHRLVESAIKQRVAEPLPFDVPKPLADELEEETSALKSEIQSREWISRNDIELVVPDLFPDVIQNGIENIRSEGPVDASEQYTVITFLASIGLSREEVVSLINPDSVLEPMIRGQAESIQSQNGKSFYAVPSYEALVERGMCQPRSFDYVTPLEEYSATVENLDAESVTDWRENPSETTA